MQLEAQLSSAHPSITGRRGEEWRDARRRRGAARQPYKAYSYFEVGAPVGAPLQQLLPVAQDVPELPVDRGHLLVPEFPARVPKQNTYYTMYAHKHTIYAKPHTRTHIMYSA